MLSLFVGCLVYFWKSVKYLVGLKKNLKKKGEKRAFLKVVTFYLKSHWWCSIKGMKNCACVNKKLNISFFFKLCCVLIAVDNSSKRSI